MTDKRYDPEGAAEIWRAKMDAASHEFCHSGMSEAVFTATLYQLGFRGSRLNEEFRYWDWKRYSLTGCPGGGSRNQFGKRDNDPVRPAKQR